MFESDSSRSARETQASAVLKTRGKRYPAGSDNVLGGALVQMNNRLLVMTERQPGDRHKQGFEVNLAGEEPGLGDLVEVEPGDTVLVLGYWHL